VPPTGIAPPPGGTGENAGSAAAAALPRPETVAPLALLAVAERFGARLTGPDRAVTGVTAATGQVHPGDLFAGVPGARVHGARYAAQAIEAGAVAVLTDAEGSALVPAEASTLVVGDVRAALGPISAAVYGEPSRRLRVIGITGTSGKTTTAFLVRAGLQAAGRPAGLVGTVGTFVGDELVKTGFTTPEAPEIQALLATLVERGVADVVMEVSSHALAMHRVDGIAFRVAAFTNLSQDHLDFHTDMEDYFAAKARLFGGGFGPDTEAVVMVDDEWGRRLSASLDGAITVSTSDAAPATWSARDIEEHPGAGSTFRVLGPGVDLAAGCALPGRFNVANTVLALALLDRVGVQVAEVAPAVAAAGVPGRMERIDVGQPFAAVVDYSHKPAAVQAALRALRASTPGRLVVVLGSGGDRDRAKRPMMGEVAARGADVLIVTDDNPRSEEPAEIRAAMLAGALSVPDGERGEVREVGDRAEAIAAAVSLAGPGDTVLVAGKGHEPGQEIAGVVHPFDDREVLRSALRAAS
jgi:UDP-N-acetylmuramoyl-L-alanyl-D-glutamate--2,6-diaminopimelate ligase